jgi:hypothetical protein
MGYCAREGFHDPIDGGLFRGDGETPEEAQWLTDIYKHLVFKHQISVRELWEMVELATIDQREFFDGVAELRELHSATKRDADRLSASPGLAEVLAILTRNQARMLRMAELEPDLAKRKRIEDFLIAAAAEMQASYDRAKQRLINAKHRAGLNG